MNIQREYEKVAEDILLEFSMTVVKYAQESRFRDVPALCKVYATKFYGLEYEKGEIESGRSIEF